MGELKSPGGALLMCMIIASFLPVWRCGLRHNLTFWEFAGEHTIFGHPVQYIPEEKYEEELRRELY